MRNLSIQTKSGTTILPPNYIIPVVENGQIVEKYAFELKSGDTVIYHKESAPIALDELVEISYASIPAYREARDLYFYRKEGYEVTRLRKDIIESVAEQRPQIFSEEELQNLEDYTLKKENKDFSPQTQVNMLDYIVSLFEPFRHSRSTYKSWMDGDVIHPKDHIEAVEIAKTLENEDFRQRTIYTEITPKSENNKYWMMTDFHRVMLSILSPLRKHAKGKISKEKLEEIYHRVYMDFPFWYKPVIEKVRPKLEESIVYSPVTEVKVVESGEIPIKMRTNTELKKGVVGFESVDEVEKENLFQKLKLEKPKISRREQLIKDLDERFELIKKASNQISYILVKNVLNEDAKTSLLRSSVLIESAKRLLEEGIAPEIEYDKILKTYTSRSLVLSEATFHPTNRHDINSCLQKCKEKKIFFNKCLENKKFRKDIKKSLKKSHLHEDDHFYKIVSEVYDKSTLLKHLFPKRKSIDLLSVQYREGALYYLKSLGSESIPSDKARIENAIKLENEIMIELYNNEEIKEFISNDKKFDSKIPIELRHLQHIINFQLYNDIRILLEKYGIDPEWFEKKMEEVREEFCFYTISTIGHTKVKNEIIIN